MESNRYNARLQLEKKLYILDPNLGSVLMEHRKICCEMEKDNYFVDIPKGSEDKTLSEFS